jgi:hypothetical protein
MGNNYVWTWDYDTLRRILELLSFLGTTVVGVFAFFVFSQLRMAKKSLETAEAALTAAKDDMEVRIQREAVVIAAEQIERFRSVIIQDINVLDERFASAKIPFGEWPLKNYSFDEQSIEKSNDADAFVTRAKSAGLQDLMIDLLNELETYSLFFVEGAADEKIAFPLTSNVYCNTIKQLAPLLIRMRKGDRNLVSGPYKNIIRLYELWALRMKKNELDSKASLLLKESSAIHITDAPVLGRR